MACLSGIADKNDKYMNLMGENKQQNSCIKNIVPPWQSGDHDFAILVALNTLTVNVEFLYSRILSNPRTYFLDNLIYN